MGSSLFNTSQVIERNRQSLAPVRTLLINPPADSLLQQWPTPAVAWVWDETTRQCLDFPSVGVQFGPLPILAAFGQTPEQRQFAQILLFMPKSQAELNFLWQSAVALLAPQGSIFLVGEKREGIESTAKRLQTAGNLAAKIDSARHCQLWQLQPAAKAELPRLEDWEQRCSVDFGRGELQLVALPGVFSAGRLDEGTALLLQHMGTVPVGAVLDFGCGCGVVGAALKQAQPEIELHQVDVHAMALESTRRTLRANGLQGNVYASNGLAQVPGSFAAIYTNPPFHAGVRTDYQVTEQMILDAFQHLEPGGFLQLVANAFLDYPQRLQAVFGNCEVLAETSKFRVYRAIKKPNGKAAKPARD